MSEASRNQVDRHFTVAVFVVHKGRVILMRHPRLGLWLPPGGHIEPSELPDDAARREVLEETGLTVELVGDMGSHVGVRPQTRPIGVQIEPIARAHEHIDLIYAARLSRSEDTLLKAEAGTSGLGWYTEQQAREMGATVEVLSWVSKALDEVVKKPGV